MVRVENSLVDFFNTYVEIKQTDNNVPLNFWSEVSKYWSNTEGNEHLSNNAVRKRFNRRYKRLESANFSKDIYDDILLELKQDDRKFYGEDDLEYETITTSDSNDVSVYSDTNEQVTEFSTEKDFNDEAKDKGVLNEYQQFLKEQGIDEDEVVNVYYKQKASGIYFTVQTNQKEEEIEEEDLLGEIREFLSNNTPDFSNKFDELRDDDTSEKICILSAFDAHIDKISYIDETDEESSLYDNIRQFDDAIDSILPHVKASKPEYILFPLGSDFWHVNDYKMTTKKGTEMLGTVHPNVRESFREGLRLLRRSIDKLRTIAPVKLMFLLGNHDEDQVKYLLEVMRIAYENQSDVEVIDSIKSRQYERYGNCLFGFAHGDNERKASDLPNRMATDADSKKHWSDIELGVFFLGDIHHEKKYKFMEAHDFRGVNVKFLRSMSGEDGWHWKKGFNGGLRSIYCFVYSKYSTKEQLFKVNLK